VLEAQELAGERGGRVVFAGISFALAPGGALLLTGPNGAGKTSLLRALAGLGRITAGALLWEGRPALADRPTHATRLALVGHQDALKPALTVAETLAHEARILGGDAEAALAHATPYMQAFGHTVLAWIWLELATVATTSPTVDPTTRAAIVNTGRWFFAHELPRVAAWLQPLEHGDRTVLETKEAWL